MGNKVYLTKIDGNDVMSPMRRLVASMDLPSELRQGLGIKLNLCDYRRPNAGCTTDPLVLEALLAVLRNHYPSAKLFLFENDATGTLADNLFLWLGLDKVAAKYDVPFINLIREEWVPVHINGYHFTEVEVPRVLLESLIMNHPKLKTHGRTKITCGLKNMFGCYRIKQKDRYHQFLDKAIVDINMAVKTHYTLVDGLLCLEGNRGPTQGYPKRVGVFIGGSDIVAVDAFCAKLMGFRARSIKYIRLAAGRGIGSISYDLESELRERELQDLKFRFSLLKYHLMGILRKVIL